MSSQGLQASLSAFVSFGAVVARRAILLCDGWYRLGEAPQLPTELDQSAAHIPPSKYRRAL